MFTCHCFLQNGSAQNHKQFQIKLKGSKFCLDGWDLQYSSVRELMDSLKNFVLMSGSESFTVKKCCLPRHGGSDLVDLQIIHKIFCIIIYFLWYRAIQSFGDEDSASTFLKNIPGTSTLYPRQRSCAGKKNPSSHLHKTHLLNFPTKFAMWCSNRDNIWAVGRLQTYIKDCCLVKGEETMVRRINSTTTPVAKQRSRWFLRS